MATIDQLTIKFIADTAELINGANSVNDALDRVSDNAKKTDEAFKNAFESGDFGNAGVGLNTLFDDMDKCSVGAEELADNTKKAGDETENFGKRSHSALSSIIPSWKEMALAATAAIGVIAGAGVTMVQMAADADATIAKFDAVFGDSSAAVTAWADSFSDATGRNRYEVMESVSTLQALMVGMGTNREEAAKMSQTYEQLSLDMAAFFNTSDADAMSAIMSGISGESEPLKRYGILLTETAVQEELVRMKGGDMAAQLAAAGDDPEKLEMVKKNFEDITKNVTETEKAQARYNIIMRSTGDLQGQQAREASGYQEQMKRLFATIKEGATDAGMSAMMSMTGVLNKVNEIIDTGGLETLQSAFESIADAVGRVAEITLDAALAFREWGASGAFAVLKEFAGSILINLQQGLRGSVNALSEFAGSGGLGRLEEAAKITLQGMVKFNDFLGDVGVYKVLGNALEGTVRVILGLVDVIARAIIAFRDFYTAANNMYAQVTSGTAGLRAAISSDFEAIRSVITTVTNTIRNIVTTSWNAIRTVITTVNSDTVSIITGTWNTIRNTINTSMNTIINLINTAWNAIRTLIVAALNAIRSEVVSAWGGIQSSITTSMNTIRNLIITDWNTIRTAITTAMNAINTAVSTAWSGIMSTISTGVEGAISAVTGAASRFYTAGSNWIDQLISGVSSRIPSLRSTVNEALSLVGLSSGSSSSSRSSSGSSSSPVRTTSTGAPYAVASPTTIRQAESSGTLLKGAVVVNINNKAADVTTVTKTVAKAAKSAATVKVR